MDRRERDRDRDRDRDKDRDRDRDREREREREKKPGFWGNIFRSRSVARRVGIGKLEKEQPRRASDGDATLRRRRTDATMGGSEGRDSPRGHRKPRYSEPTATATSSPSQGTSSKGKDREDPRSPVFEKSLYDDHVPLTEWPPSGMSSEAELTPPHAKELISKGTPCYRGHVRDVPHASDDYYALYVTTSEGKGQESDSASIKELMIQLMTMHLSGREHARYPWETLEQPSCAYWFGKLPGTVTLNQFVSAASALPQSIPLRDPGIVLRDISLERILERLKDLEVDGLEEDDEAEMYRTLYKSDGLLRDPDRVLSPHKTLDKQITDLIQALSRPDWIDFTNPKNQVVTRFIFDRGHANHATYLKFFHQLLLNLELDLRIGAKVHSDWAKERLLGQIPPTIQWGIAVARRWRKYVRIERYGATADQVKLRSKLRRRQVKAVAEFAERMKWPNLADTLEELRSRDSSVDDISSDAMAFFSGLVLPGPSYPFLMMNTLIDIDPDKATDDLALLTHMYPQCGFQYRNSYTYWSAMSIVGKVLAPTCKQAAGWVGPGRPTVDLSRSQIARIRARRPRKRIALQDVQSMGDRSDPLGPPTEVFPVDEYKLIVPDVDDIIDTVRIELLSLKTVPDKPDAVPGPKWFDATIQFAIDGQSWPLRLLHDVSFVSAWPCSQGPHPLFQDYLYTAIKADDIVLIKDWGGIYGREELPASARASPAIGNSGTPGKWKDKDKGKGKGKEADQEEKVLAVESFGVRDNEVLVRAWCAHWGLGAVVADIRKTCMACAIREAYAATLTVVILIDGQAYDDEE